MAILHDLLAFAKKKTYKLPFLLANSTLRAFKERVQYRKTYLVLATVVLYARAKCLLRRTTLRLDA